MVRSAQMYDNLSPYFDCGGISVEDDKKVMAKLSGTDKKVQKNYLDNKKNYLDHPTRLILYCLFSNNTVGNLLYLFHKKANHWLHAAVSLVTAHIDIFDVIEVTQ
jgi:hypothetical protein